MEKRIIVGLNGASGIIYGNRTLMHLRDIEDLVCAAPPNACGVGDG
jgi:3-polyprenyl-4-hydroxybenzoate decarboxylase